MIRRHAWLLPCCLCLSTPAAAQLALERAQVERLGNGLTLIVLEEHSLPSASVQMLYRAGARDEHYGVTGVAHFLEHMAFRATANFPDTEVVSRIYAAGGEWHGYTWIDQTTYYATVPSGSLDLLLRIEADRLARLEIDPALVEPERGAVLAELHGYENDPATVLHDAVVFTALQAHPYRNNTIGWESDIRAMRHEDLVAFYRRHYVPANAVLAVVGDVDAAAVRRRVQELFGGTPATPPTAPPRTVEPPQNGERRIELLGAGAEQRFEIAWQAPGVRDPDFPAFLIVQEWLGGGSGVNFMQEFGSTPARPGSFLGGLTTNVRTWFPPSARTYLFSIAGTVPADSNPAEIESAVEQALARLRDTPAGKGELAALRDRVLAELVFDVETHEDAAHQLAFFEGLGASVVLQELAARVAALEADAVQMAARRWLQPQQRTIGWYRAGFRPPAEPPAAARADPAPMAVGSEQTPAAHPEARPTVGGGIDQPVVVRLDNGLPVIVQRSALSATAYLLVVLNTAAVTGDSGLQVDDPVWGRASLGMRCRPADLSATLRRLRSSVDALQPLAVGEWRGEDPAARLDAAYRELLGVSGPAQPQPAAASLIVVAGDVDPAVAQAEVARHFADAPHPGAGPAPAFAPSPGDLRIGLPVARSQAQIGYAVPAPLPADPQFLAWRALLYVLTHGYEGRLGKEAIGRRGLAYYVDGQYRSDGQRAWIAISTGVDPEKLQALEALYRSELAGLVARPPSEAEVAGAREYFEGRLRTARQSNAELSAGLAEQWLWHGRIPGVEERLAALRALTRAEVLQAVPGFIAGRFAVVEVGTAAGTVTD
jgi:zinc protease